LGLRLTSGVVLAADHGGRAATAAHHGIVDELRRRAARRHRIAGKIIAGGLGKRLLVA
jgi:hypothetical protein